MGSSGAVCSHSQLWQVRKANPPDPSWLLYTRKPCAKYFFVIPLFPEWCVCTVLTPRRRLSVSVKWALGRLQRERSVDILLLIKISWVRNGFTSWHILCDSSTSFLSRSYQIKQSRMFHDDSMRSFFRRLSFTPDGSFLLAPGINTTCTKITQYLFSDNLKFCNLWFPPFFFF